MTVQTQPTLFNDALIEDIERKNRIVASRTGTFTDNMKLPIHRWYRYSAGFSAEWVEEQLLRLNANGKDCLLDPFVGSGTSLISSQKLQIPSIGIEAHPFVYRIARAKNYWGLSTQLFHAAVEELIEEATQRLNNISIDDCPEILKRSYDTENLKKLEAIRLAYIDNFINKPETEISELLWLVITSVLRPCSTAGTAQWQYLLPNKTKKRVLDPFIAIRQKRELMIVDMLDFQNLKNTGACLTLNDDARDMKNIAPNSISLVITSPPYPNNYDYADATRLELTYWREIDSWGDLHDHIRKYLLRSCSQHTSKDKLDLDTLLKNPALSPIKDEITKVCQELAEVRKTKGGRKAYHTMIAAYFIDLSLIWQQLRIVCKPDSKICFVIGDSAPYGVYVPVEEWLGKLALSAGFKSYEFEKIRDRNIKWKNRKHRVPLKEGNLWVEG